jgi:hypothetical protein
LDGLHRRLNRRWQGFDGQGFVGDQHLKHVHKLSTHSQPAPLPKAAHDLGGMAEAR